VAEGPSITVGARVSFAAIHQIPDRLRNTEFPIELALPFRYAWWKEAAKRLDEMLTPLGSAGLVVPTIHATQARISEDDFLTWGRQTIQIAEHLGAETITVHPNRARKDRANHQFMAARNLRIIGRETNVTIAIETFGGRDRVFRPEEILEAGLPMTLDVAHIADNARILKIIDRHWRQIPVVHLSARGSNYWGRQKDVPLSDEGRSEHHLPIDPFCIDVVRMLVKLGWSGAIALEYLPWHHYRLRGDVALVTQALEREIAPEELPLPCDIYRGMNEMSGHNAPPLE